jgi:CheY-like chemotaxis protein
MLGSVAELPDLYPGGPGRAKWHLARAQQAFVESFGVRARGGWLPGGAVCAKSLAALGGFGFAFLLASSVSLLANIETAFNQIFRAPKPRPLALRFGIYWCLLTLGPFLLSLSIAGTALLERSRALGPLRNAAGIVLPLLVTCGAFTMLYLIVPAVQVRRRSALLGAVVAGTAWEVAKIVYAIVSAQSVRRDAIYGSLSAIPTFLLWTYVSWIIVLFGARIAYAAQATHATLETTGAGAGPLEREVLAARVMANIANAFHNGTAPPGVRTTAEALHADEALIARDGLNAVEAAANWKPDVVLLDIGLPQLDGYEAARRIRAQHNGVDGVMLIATTGWGQDNDRRRSAQEGLQPS